jgi:hypothetical protein
VDRAAAEADGIGGWIPQSRGGIFCRAALSRRPLMGRGVDLHGIHNIVKDPYSYELVQDKRSGKRSGKTSADQLSAL